MKKLLILVVLLTIFMGCTVSKRMITLKDRDKYELKPDKLKEITSENQEFDAVFLVHNLNEEYHGSKSFNSEILNKSTSVYRKYIVLNPDNDSYTTLSFTLNKFSVIDSLIISVKYPHGVKKFFTINDFDKEKNSAGSIIYKLAYPNVVKGTVIEEGYDITQNSHIQKKTYDTQILSTRIPCKKFTYRFALPSWMSIDVKDIAKDIKLDYKQEVKENKTIYTYSKNDIKIYKDEIYSPYLKDIVNYFTYRLTNYVLSGYIVDIPDNWNDISKQFEGFIMHKDGFLRFNVGSVTRDLIEDKTDDLEILKAINSFVQKNIEIDDKFEKRNFAQILDDKKGDPFSICGLVHSMLVKADLDPKYLLVHSADKGYFDKDFYSFGEISYPAIGLEIKDKKYVIFPWLKYLDVNHVPELFRDETALVINESYDNRFPDYNSEPEFWTLPSGKLDDNTDIEEFELEIKEDGIIVATEKRIISGTLAYALREEINEFDNEEYEEFLKESILYSDGEVEFISKEILNKEDYKKPLIFKFQYKIKNLVTVLPDEILFQTSGLFSPTSFRKYKIDTKKRINPIEITYSKKFVKEIEITYPPTWKLQTELNNLSYSNLFGEIQAEYKNQNPLKIEQQVLLEKTKQPKEKITELLEIMGEKNKLNIPTLIFDVKQEL